MKIKQVEITNFRNIEHSIFNLEEVNCFEAKNHTGKTNTILAIYWTFTGKLLDGSSNDLSVKPIGNTSSEVSVKLTTESDAGNIHIIERRYKEKWTTKTKGSEELTLSGHDTKFLIDELEVKKLSEAKEEIDGITGISIDDFFKLKEIDPYQAIMNPLYLGNILEWKNLRQLIISIIGDVSNEEVLEQEPATEIAKDLFEQYGYNIEKVILFCNQQIESIGKNITELEAQARIYERTEDVPAEELEQIQKDITNYSNEVKSIQSGLSVENPKETELKAKIQDLKKNIQELELTEKSAFIAELDASKKIENGLSSKKQECQKNLDEVLSQLKAKEKEMDNASYYKNKYSRDVKDLNEARENLINSYKMLKAEQAPSYEETKCPECGAILNKDEISKKLSIWEEMQKIAIDRNIQRGKEIKLQIQEIELKQKQNQELIVKLDEEIQDLKIKNEVAEKYLNDAIDNLSNYIKNAPKLTDFKVSGVEKLIAEQYHLEQELTGLFSNKNNDSNDIITQLKLKVEELKTREADHYIYLKAIDSANETRAKIKVKQKERAKLESKKAAAQLFNKTKLEILEAKLVAHFGEEVKWVLVQNNLKEGSWDTTCYPLICGTQTPFKNGSTSEKVMTGIKIIEILKRELKINDMPILIDEIGELDSESISNVKTISNAQIIATRVNDNYNQPTLINL